MSYLVNEGFYTNGPSPYARPDFDSRVPGWGPMAYAAGPSRWGVGVLPMTAARAKTAAMKVSPVVASKVPIAQKIVGGGTTAPPAAEEGGIPWWVWLAVPMAVGGLGLLAMDMGWFGD